MAILVAMDSFKGSLSSDEANQAVKEGIQLVTLDEEIKTVQVADGGEGTVEALKDAFQLSGREIVVQNALGEPIVATYGINRITNVAVIEVAAACGLPQIAATRRQPLTATTFGVGEMIRDAIDQGLTSFYIGLGGSATTDGGFGMLKALGVRFFDGHGEEIHQSGQLQRIKRTDDTALHSKAKGCTFTIICDVENPFYGEMGAAHVYGPQKGADAETVRQLDEGLKQMASIILSEKEINLQHIKGSGAAGGLGGAFAAYLQGQFVSGAELVLEANSVATNLNQYTLIISGEGRIDSQTLHGKLPMTIGRLGLEYNVPVLLLGGSVAVSIEQLIGTGIVSTHSIANGPMTLDEMMQHDVAYKSLKETAAHCFMIWKTAHKEEYT